MGNTRRLIYTFIFLSVIALWQYAGDTSGTVRLFFSTPALAATYLSTHVEDIGIAVISTASESIAGLLFATLFSFVVMFLCCLYPTILKAMLPFFVTSQTIPLIALAPLFVILFGLGLMAKIMMAALLCFFPIFVNLVVCLTNRIVYVSKVIL